MVSGDEGGHVPAGHHGRCGVPGQRCRWYVNGACLVVDGAAEVPGEKASRYFERAATDAKG